jgi:IclR family transcriptional regulator, acetate operon repressor
MATPRNFSVIKAFAVLRAFQNPNEGLTTVELGKRTNIPEASAYRLVQTLEDVGALVRGQKGRYHPGLLLLSLSQNVTPNELLRDASRQFMTELAENLQLTIHLGVLEDGMVTYIEKVTAPGTFPIHTRVGAQLEAYCSGLGKILLAAKPQDEIERFIQEGALVPLTPYTITSAARLREELHTVRKSGFAIDDRENKIDIRCVAVPVLDNSGRTMAALSASDETGRMDQVRQRRIRHALQEAVAQVGKKLFPLPSTSFRATATRIREGSAVSS